MPQGKGTYGDQVGRPPSPNKSSGFKMKGFSAFTQKDDNKQEVFNKKVDDLKNEYSKITDKNSNRAEQLKKEAKTIGLTLEQKPSYSADTGDM